jgi:hypothetical protein
MKSENLSPTKSQLAKLLATENINITIDATMKTAAFDLKTRTMYLPNWEGVSSDVTDLLVGHETGHALFTSEEGWHGAIDKRGARFKGFLNVCEDARIEKKQKRKYPGLRGSFLRGYKELFEQDFFGVRGAILSELLLIDRVNLKCKLGSLLNVPFTAEEKLLLAEVEGTETWEQVVAVAEKLFAYCKDEQEEKKKQKEQQKQEEQENSEDDLEGEDDELEEDDEFEGEGEDEWNTAEDDNGEESSDFKPTSDAQSSDESGEEESPAESDAASDAEVEEAEGSPESVTDSAFRRNEESLASSHGFNTIQLPQVGSLDKIVIPNAKIRDMMELVNHDAYLVSGSYTNRKMKESVTNFLSKNKNAIDLYVKEFQMRKSAASWKKARQSDTGDINPGKLAYYTMTDQVFKSRTIVPNGKNHGMILLLDWSSSMGDTFAQSMEQVLVLATVCKRVGIPFRVLAFTSRDQYECSKKDQKQAAFSTNLGELIVENVYLLDLLSSDMKAKEYNQAFEVCVSLGASLHFGYNSYSTSGNYVVRQQVPAKLQLSSTPLKPALMVMQKLIPEFQKKNRVDIMNLVVVTDGGCTVTLDNFYAMSEDGYLVQRRFNRNHEHIKVGAKLKYKNRYIDYKPHNSLQTLLTLIQTEFNVNTFGFFLLPARLTSSDMMNINSLAKDKNGFSVNIDIVRAELKEKKLFESYAKGYTRFFLIKNSDSPEVTVAKDASLTKIKSAFMKNNSDRKANRILASKFMELAA